MAGSTTTTIASLSSLSICITPLSSPYTLLPRIHTYALVLTLLLPLPRGWLFRAALAAFATRTAAFAVDACVILRRAGASAQSRASFTGRGPPSAWPDALAALSALSLAAAVACWLLLVSRRGGETAARPVVRAWAVVAGSGCCVAFAAAGALGRLIGATPAVYTPGDCHEAVLTRGEVLGGPEAVSLLGMLGSKVAWFVRRVGIPGLVFSSLAFGSVLFSAPGAGRSTLETEGSERRMHRASTVELEKSQPSEEIKQDPGPLAHLGWAVWMFNTSMLAVVPVMVALIIFWTEQYFFSMASAIPSAEKMDSIGQWGVWAATGAVLLATLFNAIRERMGIWTPAQDPIQAPI